MSRAGRSGPNWAVKIKAVAGTCSLWLLYSTEGSELYSSARMHLGDGVEYTLAQGFSALLPNWVPTAQNLNQNQNRSRNQLHLLTCWTLVKPPHCSACIFLLQLWVQSVEEQIQETERKPAFAIASNIRCTPVLATKKSLMVFSFLNCTSEIPVGN